MKRYIIATVLFVLAIEIILAIPLMVLTPIGNKVIATLNPTPIPPTSTSLPVLNSNGHPLPTLKSPVAYLLDADTDDTLLNIGGTNICQWPAQLK